MSRRTLTRLIAVAAVIVSLAAVTAATAHQTAHAANSPANQIRAAERTLFRAAVDGDTHTAGPLLAPDLQLIDVTGTAETRADDLANIAGAIDFVTIKPVSPIRVRVHGNSAVARVELLFKVVAHGTKLQHYGWNTDLFERRGGRWELVWSQTTAVPNNIALLIEALQPAH